LVVWTDCQDSCLLLGSTFGKFRQSPRSTWSISSGCVINVPSEVWVRLNPAFAHIPLSLVVQATSTNASRVAIQSMMGQLTTSIHRYELLHCVEELAGARERNFIFQSRFCFMGDSFISMSVDRMAIALG